MKKQSILRIVIVAVIISAAFFVMAATSSVRENYGKEDCTADKNCEKEIRSEFFLESLTRSLLTR
jgi:hypothetical protein